MTSPPLPACATLCPVRFARACLDLFVMAAPILIGTAAIVGTLLFWPGAVPGVLILIVVGWLCAKQIAKILDEHHS